MNPKRRRALVRAAVVTAIVVVAFGAAFGAARLARSNPKVHVDSGPTQPPLPSQLAAASAAPSPGRDVGPGTAPTPAGVHKALQQVLQNPGFGQRLLAHVIDAKSGKVLYDSFGHTPAAPASTGKLLTAAAILAVRVPSYRFVTKVVDAGHGTIVIVGGGDPTLSAVPAGKPTIYPGAARMTDLVSQVEQSGVTVRRIEVDGALFRGPSISPHWDPQDMGTSYGSPITAFMADGARPYPKAQARSGVQPDIDAADEFAKLLGKPDLSVDSGRAPKHAKVIARVESASLGQLITQMLQESDNTIADVLARQVAVAQHAPASFTGACAAIRSVLARFGVPVGAGMKDGSGLSSDDRVSPVALVGVLRLISGATGPPAAAQLHFVAGALPVGGWSGTLSTRYATGGLAKDAGRVRAKTGTLSTVASLAGFVRDKSGRLLIFSFDSDQTVNTFASDAAMDDVVGKLADCGCA
ncbi:MAG TPA: D-alanyl-D-alanine carboxypeptidase/D-alanyl-D-alanine-endopeptidase [Jatrophihabitantaceae bacterium]